MEALHIDESVVERLMARLMALPADASCARAGSASGLADEALGRPALVRGQYQSPILVQWKAAEGQARTIDITLSQLK